MLLTCETLANENRKVLEYEQATSPFGEFALNTQENLTIAIRQVVIHILHVVILFPWSQQTFHLNLRLKDAQ